MLLDDYFDKVNEVLGKVKRTQRDNIAKGAEIIANSIENGGAVFVFGATHSAMIAEELFFRGGGLAPINPIISHGVSTLERPVSNTTKLERVEEYGKIIIESSDITNKDVLIVHSVSGKNSVPIEVAIGGKKKGAKLIVITNLEYSKSLKSNHSSGKRLFELEADVVLDNCGVIGDAVVKVEGMKQKVGPTSTICGCCIVNAIVVQVVENLMEKGITPPVFISGNIEGSDEFNKKIFSEYKDRIKYL